MYLNLAYVLTHITKDNPVYKTNNTFKFKLNSLYDKIPHVWDLTLASMLLFFKIFGKYIKSIVGIGK